MTRSSKRTASKWNKRQQGDHFAREASRLGARSRSYFKLQEMDQKFELLKPGLTMLDLGLSPGGWSQSACSRVGGEGEVIAVDILEMEPITGFRFLKLDLSHADTAQTATDWMGDRKTKIVVSDMAPNITGNSTVDAQNYSRLHTAIFVICSKIFADSGSLVFKFFSRPIRPRSCAGTRICCLKV